MILPPTICRFTPDNLSFYPRQSVFLPPTICLRGYLENRMVKPFFGGATSFMFNTFYTYYIGSRPACGRRPLEKGRMRGRESSTRRTGYSFLTATLERRRCRKLQATEGGYHPAGVLPAITLPSMRRKTHGTLSADHQKGQGEYPGTPHSDPAAVPCANTPGAILL